MGLIENKLRWCLKKAEREGDKHRGLKEINPDIEKANEHLNKAQHNLKAMLYLSEGKYLDWAVNASFYTMYHCLLAILAKYGYESRNQECTLTVVEYLIIKKEIDLEFKWLKKIASFENPEPNKKDIITLREDYQYGTKTLLDEDKLKKLIDETKDFLDIVKHLLKNNNQDE